MKNYTKICALLLAFNLAQQAPAQPASVYPPGLCSTAQDVIAPPSALASINSRSSALASTCSRSSAAYNSRYGRVAGYVPNAGTPVKVIKIAFHFFQDNSGGNNWKNDVPHLNRLSTIVNGWMNPRMAALSAPSDPIPGVAFIPDSRIQYEVTGVYFYQNTALNTSSNVANLSAAVNAADPSRLNSIPIFVTAGSYGGAWGFAQLPSELSLAAAHFVVTFNAADDPSSDYTWAGHLLHELGHDLDLDHTYTTTSDQLTTSPDYLSDIYNQPWAYYCTPTLTLPTGYVCPHEGGFWPDPYLPVPANYLTNNLMGSNRLNMYLSPLQIGKMGRALALKSCRKYVKEMTSSTNNWVVNSNEVWDFDIQTYQNIYVTNGAVLTIKCKVGMANLGKIIVDRGAKLVIDGGEIYAWGSNWEGINVWGTANKKQTISSGLSPDHGIVQIINDGTIRDANTAITTIKVDASGNLDWSYTGGIIFCDGAKFINNRRAISYLSYHNKVTNTLPTVSANMGYIYRSLFETNSVLKDPARPNPDYFITMYEVEGIKIHGNIFQNTRSPLPAIDQRGGGISTINAGFDLQRYLTCNCLNTSGICPVSCITANVPSLFKNLQYGVYASGATPYLGIYINDNSFTNCNRAIYMNAINYAIITKNIIDVGDGLNASAFLPYGIYNDHCQGYQIEENVITTSGTSGNISQGVIFNGTGGLTNSLYRNKIDKMSCGATVYGNNRGNAPGEGLLFKCNQFGQTTGANAYDISMEWGPDFYYGRIDAYQGTPNQGANNKFSHGCAGPSDYYDYDNNPVIYPVNYYYNPDATSLTKPLCYSLPLVPFNIVTTYSDNMCPSNLISSGNLREANIPQMVSRNTARIQQLTAHLDGGNREQLLKTIDGPAGNTELKDLLLSYSPYLSGEVLLAYIKRMPAPGAEDLRDIIMANSPVSSGILQQLENSTMPEAMLTQVKSRQSGRSAYTKTEELIAELNYERSFLVADKIRVLLNDTTGASPRENIIELLKLDTRPGIMSNVLSAYLESGQAGNSPITTGSNTLLRLLQLISTTNNGTQNLLTDAAAKTELEKIATQADENGFTTAKAVSKQLFGHPFEEFISLPSANSKRYVSNGATGSFTEDLSLFNVFPNPAASHFTVNYVLPNPQAHAEMQLIDVLGRVVYKQAVTGSANTIEIDSSPLPKGVYIISLVVDNKMIEYKKLSIR